MYRTRRLRLVTIACLCLVFVLLLIRDAADAFDATSFLVATFRFGFSTLVAAAFLSIGALVWYYACNRLTALLLFGFTSTMAITFAVQTGAKDGDLLLSATTSMSSLVALLCLNALLVVFPGNSIGWPQGASGDGDHHAVGRTRAHTLVLWLRGYLCVQVVLCIAAVGATILYFLPAPPAAPWLPLVVYMYAFSGLVGVLVSVCLSYKHAPSLRERQQLRLLVNGTVIALVPFTILTLLPLLLGLPAQLVVDSQISTATFAVLPLALGYAMLRYQLLFLEADVRRVVATVMGLFGLVLLAYVVIAIGSVALPGSWPEQVGFVILTMLILGSLTWWGARAATERILFNEVRHYRTLFSRPERLIRESFDLDEASWLVVAAAVDALETAAACVFILDEESGCYRPYFPLNRQDSQRLAEQVFQCVRPVAILGKKTDWLDEREPGIARLALASRPLKLSEICRAEKAALPYLLDSTQGGESDPLLAPLRVDGRMVGWLVLGARGDGQAYAGPDFEALDLMQRIFTPALETARLYALESTHAALVMKLFTGLPQQPLEDLKTLEAVARDYAKVIASAVSARAEIWLVGELDGARVLRRGVHAGPGPTPSLPEPLRVGELQAQARLSASFLTWHRKADLLEALAGVEAGVSPPAPPGESASATFSCAWLPLLQGEELLGVLVLTYARPHAFSSQEQRLLALFANQCAAALDNTRILRDLDAACASEIAWDLLRDQFLLAASHDLRRPLTTVGGYIEMVGTYSDRLSPESRSEFLARAQHAANELVLLVSNIMDVLTDMEQAPLAPVALQPALWDILELLQGSLKSCGLSARIEVDPALRVLADELRLRQVLLNLLSNALAQAQPCTALEVSAQDTGREVTVCVRYGGPVPPACQRGLLAPFSDVNEDASTPGYRAGLGLSISKQQVESMGGRIWVESTAVAEGGPGSVFAFTLRSAPLQEASHLASSASSDHASDPPR